MILDKSMEVSTAQPVTTEASSTNSIDLGVAPVGNLRGIRALIRVTTSCTSAGGNAGVRFRIVSSNLATLASGLTILGESELYPDEDLTVNRSPIAVEVNRDLGGVDGLVQRYLGIRYVVAVEPLVAGSFTATFLLDPADVRVFPGAY